MQKSVTLGGIDLKNACNILLSLLICGVCLYLIGHYYDTHFPSNIAAQKSFCNLSSYWSCDIASFSPWAAPLGVPLGYGGLFMGLVLLYGVLFPSEGTERTLKFLSLLNVLGCLLLFLYSVLIANSLCPMCFAYYLLSFAVALLFFKGSDFSYRPDFKVLGIFLGTFLALGLVVSLKTQDQLSHTDAQIEDYYQQFMTLKKYPELEEKDWPFFLAGNAQEFKSKPLRLTLFSDFQCRFCEIKSQQIKKLVKKYGDKIAVSYQFYPLDFHCNKKVTQMIHPQACAAARLSACGGKEKFIAIHDEIFAQQSKISDAMLQKMAADYGVTSCFENQESMAFIQQSLTLAQKYRVETTPSFILNGIKVDGILKVKILMGIMDKILAKTP